MESAKREGDPLYAAYVLILVLGLRKGEVIGIPWNAVDLDTGELDIAWQLQRVRRQLLHRETELQPSLRDAMRSGGVRRITVHDTRHTCATLLGALDVHPASSCTS